MINTSWFINRIRDLGLSQRELAKKLDLDASAVSLMLRGKRNMSAREAAQIADVINQPVDEVMRQAGIPLTQQSETVEVVALLDTDMALSPRPGRTRIQAPDGFGSLLAARMENSASPFFGWTFFYERRRSLDPDAIGRLCVVATGGTEKIRFLQHSIDHRSYRLVRLDGTVEDEASVTTASPVLWIRT